MKKVLVGMSGGVDSSVAALLLKEQGYDVIGVTMNIWQRDDSVQACDKACCAIDAVNEARKVAAKLDIPYYNMDFREDFKKEVIDEFAAEYIAGRTPNPCIVCNKKIKFEKLLQKAKVLFDADFIATGHYAKVEQDEKTGRYFLRESDSITKDQTYALYNLSQDQLSHIVFPLGTYTKDQVREIAKKNNLDNASRHDSQEICFIEDNDYAKFIEEKYDYKSESGDFVDTKGNVLGKHKGIIHYTVGQRRGLGLSLKKPMYVFKIDKEKNQVVLGLEDEIKSNSLICTNVNFMPFEKLEGEMKVTAKIRYLAPKEKATIYSLENGYVKVVFGIPQKAITPGQAVVFYNSDIVLGGGTII